MHWTDALRPLSRNSRLRRYVGKPFIRVNEWVWSRLPDTAKKQRIVRSYGAFLQKLAAIRDEAYPKGSIWTCFLRNRAEMEYIGKLASSIPDGGPFRVAVLACSTGPEAYSVAWALRHARHRLNIEIHASDISPDVVDVARAGIYAADRLELKSLCATEKEHLLEFLDNGAYRVRDEWRSSITWEVIDACSPELAPRAATYDLVLANRFLGHMPAQMARECLQNIIRLVKPGGHLLATFVQLDVRSEVMRASGLVPEVDVIHRLYHGDRTLLAGWPFTYWGLEPLDETRPDWTYRYGIAFRKPATVCPLRARQHRLDQSGSPDPVLL